MKTHKDYNIDDLVARFSKAVKMQWQEMQLGNAKQGNHFAKIYINSFKTITKEFGDSGREKLASLLSDPDDCVKEMTAAFLLKYKHQESYEILSQLASKGGFIGLGAGECLKRWDEGQWKLDS